MKGYKLTICFALMSTGLLLAGADASAATNDAAINVKGVITPGACAVNLSNGGNLDG